jgi:hypothetical protein
MSGMGCLWVFLLQGVLLRCLARYFFRQARCFSSHTLQMSRVVVGFLRNSTYAVLVLKSTSSEKTVITTTTQHGIERTVAAVKLERSSEAFRITTHKEQRATTKRGTITFPHCENVVNI